MNYQVIFTNFAKRHFIKNFSKKYKSAWDVTFNSLRIEFEQIDFLFQKSVAEIIVEGREIKVCKTEFKIAGSNQSRHGSGNRCIVAIHKNTNIVNVLLVYHKNDLGGGAETARWKQIIKENYLEYRNLLL